MGEDMLLFCCVGVVVEGDIGLASVTPVNWDESPGYPCGNVFKSFGHGCGKVGYDGMNEVHWSGRNEETSRDVRPSSLSEDE